MPLIDALNRWAQQEVKPVFYGARMIIHPFHTLQRSGLSSSIAISNIHVVKRGSKN